MTLSVHDVNLEQIEQLSALDLLRWAVENSGERAALFTSFQDTGCAIIDMAHCAGITLRVGTVDTLRLHPETYALMESVEKRYGISIERYTPDPLALERMVRNHGEFLFFDSKAKQEYCCGVRKVEPNKRALETVDVWITGLRRDQSAFRAQTPKAEWVKREERLLLKLCPLADWTEEQVRAYTLEHLTPRNPLYDQGYASIGCVICSTPIRPGEDKRAGRWRWFNQYEQGDKKECGIHIGGSGI